MKLKFWRFLFIAFSHTLCSQVAISYFPFQSILSLSSNTEKLFWADYKLETNSFVSNLNMEISPKLNFKRSESVNYYLGPGLGFNPAYAIANLKMLNGGFLDFGVRVKPLIKYRSFQIVFEISPYVNKDFSSGNIRTRLGLAWNFIRKKKEDVKEK